MKILTPLAAVGVLTLVTWLSGCERAQSPSAPATPAAAAPAPAAAETPNANAAHYGPHGVAATPPSATNTLPPASGPDTPRAGAPPLDPGAMTEIAGHPCHCGPSCKCGHCAGAVPGCHCKAERTEGK